MCAIDGVRSGLAAPRERCSVVFTSARRVHPSAGVMGASENEEHDDVRGASERASRRPPEAAGCISTQPAG